MTDPGQLLDLGGLGGHDAAMTRAAPARRAAPTRRAAPRSSAGRRTAARTGATNSRAKRSAAGVKQYGLPLKPTWKTANYAYPGGVGSSKGKSPSYPISPRYVRAALSRSAQRNTAGSANRVRWALAQRYGSVGQALRAARR